ncbi:MAG: hypothetical protein ACXW2E_00250 [Nitrososphaeraceae archaeon]
MDETAQLEEFISTIKQRDQALGQYTIKLFSLIHDTFISALIELLDIPVSNIEWVDLFILDKIVIVTCTIIECDRTSLSPFLKFALDGHDGMDSIRIGLPIYYIFKDKEIIKDFLTTVIKERQAKTQKVESEFDITKLSQFQLEQLSLFNKKNGSKH